MTTEYSEVGQYLQVEADAHLDNTMGTKTAYYELKIWIERKDNGHVFASAGTQESVPAGLTDTIDNLAAGADLEEGFDDEAYEVRTTLKVGNELQQLDLATGQFEYVEPMMP